MGKLCLPNAKHSNPESPNSIRCVAGPIHAPASLKPGEPSLKDLHPDLAAQWHPTLNLHPRTGAVLRPEDVAPTSAYLATWMCKDGSCQCPHIWRATVNNRAVSKTWCPFCCGHQTCPCKSLAALHPKIAWDWDHEKNAGLFAEDGSPLTPENCPPASNKRVWWIHVGKNAGGHSCNFSWEAAITDRTREGGGTGCPECNKGRGPRRTVSLAVNCPRLVDEWDYEENGDLTPDKVTRGSNRMVGWKCPNSTCKLPHRWHAMIKHRAGSDAKKGSGCPLCSGHKLCPCGCNSLLCKYPDLAKEYSKKNAKGPDTVFAGGAKKVWWNCPVCLHKYLASPHARTNLKKPSACPECWGKP